VVGFDYLRWTAHAARFDYVGIERALDQPLYFVFAGGFLIQDAMRFVVEDFYELVAYDFALFLGIDYSPIAFS
jgi:hypothetical protein